MKKDNSSSTKKQRDPCFRPATAEPRQHGKPCPPIPLISQHSNHQVGHRDTLERVVSVLELLAELDYGKGLSPKAETGLYWVQMMLIESLNHVIRSLEPEKGA